MKKKLLFLCALLAAMLVMTFIPAMSFATIDDEGESGSDGVKHTILFCDSDDESWSPQYDEEDDSYAVEMANGKITVQGAEVDQDTGDYTAAEGDTVQFYILPDYGFCIYSVTGEVRNETTGETKQIDLTCSGEQDYSFEMPASEEGAEEPYQVNITIEFEEFDDSNIELTDELKESAEEIYDGDTKEVNTEEKDGFYKFVPKESGSYIFWSERIKGSNTDPEGRVVNDEGRSIVIEGSGDYDEGFEFKYYFDVEAGQTYFLEATSPDEDGVFRAHLDRNDVQGFTLEPKNSPYELYYGVDTLVDYEEEIWLAPEFDEGDKLILIKKDGTEETYVYEIYTDEEGDELGRFANGEKVLQGMPSFGEVWAKVADHPVGTTYQAPITYEGCSSTVEVAFCENPYKELTVTPKAGLASGKLVAERLSDEEYYIDWTKADFSLDGVPYVYDPLEEVIINKSEGKTFNLSQDVIDNEDGTGTVMVKVAGLSVEMEVAIVEHEHTWGTYIEPATLDEDGWTMRQCKVCGDQEGGATIYKPAKYKFAAVKYTGKARKPAVTITDTAGEVIKATNYTVKYANNIKAGKSAKATITFTGKYYHGTITKYFTIAKATQKLTVKAPIKTLKAKTLKKRALVVAPLTVKKQGGKLTYKKVSGSFKLKINAKTGKVTVKKKTKKGTYKARVKVTSAASANYNAASKTVTITIKVK